MGVRKRLAVIDFDITRVDGEDGFGKIAEEVGAVVDVEPFAGESFGQACTIAARDEGVHFVQAGCLGADRDQAGDLTGGSGVFGGREPIDGGDTAEAVRKNDGRARLISAESNEVSDFRGCGPIGEGFISSRPERSYQFVEFLRGPNMAVDTASGIALQTTFDDGLMTPHNLRSSN